MVITLLTIFLMFIMFSISGIAIKNIFDKTSFAEQRVGSFYDSLWLGMSFFTVYAEVCSLIGPVSTVACIGAILLTALFFLIHWHKYFELAKKCLISVSGRSFAIFLVCILVALLWGVQYVSHYDTYLYHAQSIRWIEEFGVVKGLGNLHNRFAYNSAFMCLQALFSFAWVCDRSLHTVNTFLWLFMMLYAVGTLQIFKLKKIFLSDCFKLLIVVFLCSQSVLGALSSPHTDLMTLSLVAYIITRWVELYEMDEKEVAKYGVLCLLGVFAVSVKLSAVLVLILVIKPAFELVKDKRWKTIGLFLCSGLLIILPWLIRNIVISGYLVYPYAGIDLFNVDWKMPSFQVTFDNHEIIVWGRKLNDVNRYSESILVWLPHWLKNVEVYEAIFMILNIALVPVSLYRIIKQILRKKYEDGLILLCITILFAGWLFTAPLPRYGMIYLYLLPVYFGWVIVSNFNIKVNKILVSAVLIGTSIYILIGAKDLSIKWYYSWPADYGAWYEMESIDWNNMQVYTPKEGDQTNYLEFPAIPYAQRLDVIELRGDEMVDGFRVKEEYRDKKLNPNGFIME